MISKRRNAVTGYPEVQYFADLPSYAIYSNKIYLVREPSGIYFFGRKEAGLYFSNGGAWVFIGSRVETTAIDVGGTQLIDTSIELKAGVGISLTPTLGDMSVTIAAAGISAFLDTFNATSDWTASGDKYYIDFTHGKTTSAPNVVIYKGINEVIVDEIEVLTIDSLRIYVNKIPVDDRFAGSIRII